jgi:transcriptional regulator of heat shock response
MPTIHLEAQVSRESLLKAIEQLNPQELDQLVIEVQNLRDRRGTARLTAAESNLMNRINQGLPEALRSRYNELIVRRRSEVLTSEELDELLRLTALVEQLEGSRLEALAELARLRGVALAALMAELGIPAHTDE